MYILDISMKEYKCETCYKEFKQKNDYTRHLNRKISCNKSNHLSKSDDNTNIVQIGSPCNKSTTIPLKTTQIHSNPLKPTQIH